MIQTTLTTAALAFGSLAAPEMVLAQQTTAQLDIACPGGNFLVVGEVRECIGGSVAKPGQQQMGKYGPIGPNRPSRKLPHQQCRVHLPDGSAYTKYECLVPILEREMDQARENLINGRGTDKQYRDALEAWSKAKARL
jgi:hypothetical protein